MVVTDTQKAELVKILTQHVPEYALRVSITQETVIGEIDVSGPPADAWARIIDQAERRGKLRSLLANASRLSPFDSTLEALAETAAVGRLEVTDHRMPERADPIPWRIFVFGFLGALVIVATAVWGAKIVDSLPWDDAPEPSAEVPQVEVRGSLAEPAKPKPQPVVAPEPEPEPEPEVEPDLPKASSGKYIKIPDPGAEVDPEPEPVSSD